MTATPPGTCGARDPHHHACTRPKGHAGGRLDEPDGVYWQATEPQMPPQVADALCGTCGHEGSVHYLLSPNDHGCDQCEAGRYAAMLAEVQP